MKAWAAYLPVSSPIKDRSMVHFRSKLSLAAAVLAATTMTASPLAAAELPYQVRGAPGAYDPGIENAQGYGYRYDRYRPRRGHISTGDVIAGVAVIGVLAAIASSASNNRSSTETYRAPPPPQRQSRGWNSNGIDSAVDMCVDQVERGRDRVDSVDNAARDASGWNVSGRLDNGDGFTCRIDNDGRIRAIDIGDGFATRDLSYGQGAQLSDDTYARARAATRSSPREWSDQMPVDGDIANDDLRPAYPGGPLPGEEGYEESWGG
jgi:hypothetical protein